MDLYFTYLMFVQGVNYELLTDVKTGAERVRIKLRGNRSLVKLRYSNNNDSLNKQANSYDSLNKQPHSNNNSLNKVVTVNNAHGVNNIISLSDHCSLCIL